MEDNCNRTLPMVINIGRQIGSGGRIVAHVREMDYTGEGGFYSYSVECREAERDDFYGTYGGIFYLGVILSIVFVLPLITLKYRTINFWT